MIDQSNCDTVIDSLTSDQLLVTCVSRSRLLLVIGIVGFPVWFPDCETKGFAKLSVLRILQVRETRTGLGHRYYETLVAQMPDTQDG